MSTAWRKTVRATAESGSTGMRAADLQPFVREDSPAGLRWVSVEGFLDSVGGRSQRLPRSLRLLLEATLVAAARGRCSLDPARAIAGWRAGQRGVAELVFPVSRIVLQDASGTPLLADLAALRDAAVARGLPANSIQPAVPVTLVVDHSVRTDHHGSPDAAHRNTKDEIAGNAERYAFLRWAEQAFEGLTIVPPGNGIVHQVHLERLARIVVERDGWLMPDIVVGTDSHTTMINGLGMPGWGVGGIEAMSIMLGDMQSLALPEIIGVRLTGRPQAGTLAADIALSLAAFLRQRSVDGAWLEFHGEGAAALSLVDRATIANMAPEFGASLSLFPVDERTLDYLASHGHGRGSTGLVRRHLERQGAFGFAGFDEIHYDRLLEFDLSRVGATVAGPNRPYQAMPLHGLRTSLDLPKPDRCASTEVRADCRDKPPERAAIVLAAITSCTNTANLPSMVAAGLLARNAVALGLETPRWVKTVLAPGSRDIVRRLATADLLEPLERLGFHVAAYGCAACVGNAGALVPGALEETDPDSAVAVLSGNRNFEGRIHPRIPNAYLMNPALVVAFALAGRADLDLETETIGSGTGARPIKLEDIWPAAGEISSLVDRIGTCSDGGDASWSVPEDWDSLPRPGGETFPWRSGSTYFQPPPFMHEPARHPALSLHGARPLLILGDAVTTDHISPVGSIPSDSVAGRYLASRGVERAELNSYASRRGNSAVMVRGTFANPRLGNLMTPGQSGPWTRHLPDAATVPVFDAARQYRDTETPCVVLAGRRYGMGSARDWAAKGTALLGIRAVVAAGFEAIHRSNLVRMGVLPVRVVDADWCEFLASIATAPDISVDVELDENRSGRAPTARITVSRNGEARTFRGCCEVGTAREWTILRAGGIVPHILAELS